ncbi:hypothetical protein C2E23DRAFT_256491 [Lenzites betulinus]|nr:hypothetical protein C2E23DRAFT_256491 [Lenzites betulinus]
MSEYRVINIPYKNPTGQSAGHPSIELVVLVPHVCPRRRSAGVSLMGPSLDVRRRVYRRVSVRPRRGRGLGRAVLVSPLFRHMRVRVWMRVRRVRVGGMVGPVLLRHIVLLLLVLLLVLLVNERHGRHRRRNTPTRDRWIKRPRWAHVHRHCAVVRPGWRRVRHVVPLLPAWRRRRVRGRARLRIPALLRLLLLLLWLIHRGGLRRVVAAVDAVPPVVDDAVVAAAVLHVVILLRLLLHRLLHRTRRGGRGWRRVALERSRHRRRLRDGDRRARRAAHQRRLYGRRRERGWRRGCRARSRRRGRPRGSRDRRGARPPRRRLPRHGPDPERPVVHLLRAAVLALLLVLRHLLALRLRLRLRAIHCGLLRWRGRRSRGRRRRRPRAGASGAVSFRLRRADGRADERQLEARRREEWLGLDLCVLPLRACRCTARRAVPTTREFRFTFQRFDDAHGLAAAPVAARALDALANGSERLEDVKRAHDALHALVRKDAAGLLDDGVGAHDGRVEQRPPKVVEVKHGRPRATPDGVQHTRGVHDIVRGGDRAEHGLVCGAVCSHRVLEEGEIQLHDDAVGEDCQFAFLREAEGRTSRRRESLGHVLRELKTEACGQLLEEDVHITLKGTGRVNRLIGVPFVQRVFERLLLDILDELRKSGSRVRLGT